MSSVEVEFSGGAGGRLAAGAVAGSALTDPADRVARLLGRTGRGIADTPASVGVPVVAPGAAAAIQTTANLAAGVYEIFVTVAIGPGGVAADFANTQLQDGAAVLARLANPAPGSQTFGPFRRTMVGGTALTVNAVGAGTAAVPYAASIVATRLE
jgi:hypothetical protein